MAIIKVPAFLLRRLYVKSSLKNTGDGFQFQLKNTLGSGYAKKLLPLKVDGQEAPVEQSYFIVDARETAFDKVSEQTPFTLAMNKTTTLGCRGVTLSPEAHTIAIGFTVVGLGDMSFDFTDTVM